MKPTFWVRNSKLLAGPYPGSVDPSEARENLRHLLSLGIREFVDLTEEGEPTLSTGGKPLLPYDGVLARVAEEMGVAIRYRRFPIRDLGVPEPELMEEILDHIDEKLACPDRPVYVHCLGGRGRTGTVVACHLIRHAEELLGGRDRDVAERALAEVVRMRTEQGVPDPADAPQTAVQFRLVRQWAK
jgi:hypothetical protein